MIQITTQDVLNFFYNKITHSDKTPISYVEFWRQYIGYKSEDDFKKDFFALYKLKGVAVRNWQRLMWKKEETSEKTSEETPVEIISTNYNNVEQIELQEELGKSRNSLKELIEEQDKNSKLRERNSIFIHDAEEEVSKIEELLESILGKLSALKTEVLNAISADNEFAQQDSDLTISITALKNKIFELEKEIERKNNLIFVLYSWDEQNTIDKLDRYPKYVDLGDAERAYNVQESDRLAQMGKFIALDSDIRDDIFKSPLMLKNIATIARLKDVIGDKLVIILERKNVQLVKILTSFEILYEILN